MPNDDPAMMAMVARGARTWNTTYSSILVPDPVRVCHSRGGDSG